MGATSWRYFTDLRGDVGVALKELQEKVFRTGKYECQYGGDPHDWIEGLDVLFAQAGMPPPKPPPFDRQGGCRQQLTSC